MQDYPLCYMKFYNRQETVITNLVVMIKLQFSCFRSRIVSPVIDVIDWKTFQYYPSMDLQRGVFDWKLDFHWKPLPESEENVQLSPISPIR